MIHRLLFEGQINIQRRTYLWNMLASLTYGIQSALFLLVAIRVGGETEAGEFILLFTVAQTLNVVGNYSVRDFQASDVQEEYSFPTYFTARVITCGIMIALTAAYCIRKQLSIGASVVLFCLAGYRLAECIEDVFHGDIQRAGRFDAVAACVAIRSVLAGLGFCIAYYFSRNQITASVVLFSVCVVLCFYLLHVVRIDFRTRTPIRFSGKKVIGLLTACFRFLSAHSCIHISSMLRSMRLRT